MAIKKSELYSSLWSSCDELRGGMDASQYKDYVLVMLFIKYISDKHAGKPFAPITIPKGASFSDMVALKGSPTIGDDINKKILAPLANANKLSSMPDFNDPEKLGTGKEMVDKLTNLIAIFENPALDFGKNRAEGDDILGDAYEYLMRHFATESGKSKGQFYTPAEVSRIMAKIIGIDTDATTASTTVYDPTCGSGSLLLKVADQAGSKVTLYGQEKDASNTALARMNMILHNNPTAEVKQGNTLANPRFEDKGNLRTFDYVVANPPFSDKRWGNGVDTENDAYKRFDGYGVPPAKNGDYAYLLHIIRSLKSRGKGACILPHGVLFRGNAEADIREALIRKGMIKGIIGLPANLFYGTGIPACIILIDKEDAHNRKSIFIVDANKGFIKDGNKNRLREMDIHQIADVFNKQTEIDGYSKIISFADIEKNEFNLNIPRYIDSSESEDLQDIEAHLLGDIPRADIEALQNYWKVLPTLKKALFSQAARSNKYVSLQTDKDDIKQTIYQHSEFVQYMDKMSQVFIGWETGTTTELKALEPGFRPKTIIFNISEALLSAYAGKALIDRYDVYQHLMSYWSDKMQDDCYLIAADGWQAETYRIIATNKKGNEVDKGWTCDLIPKILVISRYFVDKQQAINNLNSELESLQSQFTELEEEHNGDEGVLAHIGNKTDANQALKEYWELVWKRIDLRTYNQYQLMSQLQNEQKEKKAHFDKLKVGRKLDYLRTKKGNVTITAVKKQLQKTPGDDLLKEFYTLDQRTKEIRVVIAECKLLPKQIENKINELLQGKSQDDYFEDMRIIRQYLQLTQTIADTKKAVKEAWAKLDDDLLLFYPTLSEEQIKQLVVDDKWMGTISKDINSEMDRISQRLTQRIKVLSERYEKPLPEQIELVADLEQVVNEHLQKMGFVWS